MIPNFLNFGLIDNLATAISDDLPDFLFRRLSLPSIITVPQFNLDPNRILGTPNDIQCFLPPLYQTGLSYTIFWSPTPKIHQLREHILKFTQTAVELDLRILFPTTKERDHLIDSLGVGHH